MSLAPDPATPENASSESMLQRLGGLPTRSYAFDDLRLQVDHRLQVVPPSARPGQHFYTRLIGFLKGGSLIVRLPGGTAAIPLEEGETVQVRGFSGRIAYAFRSEALKIRYLPYAYCHLSFPDEILGAEIRKAVRVRVRLPAQLGLQGGTAQDATITDLSALGFQADCHNPLGQPGAAVTTSFRFMLQPNAYEVNFKAAGIIQGVHASEGGSGWSYGIRFLNMRSAEGILLQHLIYELITEHNATVV